jgi:23S rRNA (uracil1939-C5)-methyltransferase
LPTEATLTIEKLVYGGDGLARLDGKVVLVPYVLPGEVVRAEIDRLKNDLFRGKVLELITPSPSRVTAACPYFLRCGGCQYQHIDYSVQVEQKRAILREVLQRVGKIEVVDEIDVVAGEPWQYRNRIQVHIDRGQVGYFEHGSHKLCPIDHCPIASPALNNAIPKLNAQVTATVELFTNETEVQVNVLDRVPRSVLTALQSIGVSGPIEYAGFQVSRNSFFQVNRFLIDRLLEVALTDSEGDLALDLYAGVGLFAVSLGQRFKNVIAVESSRSAFSDLEHNIRSRSLQIKAENNTTEDYLAAYEGHPDLILADPPRSGLGKHVVKELLRIRAPQLTIISCDPATLARDLQGLLANAYRIDKITLVDLFPQTFHIEAVVHLRSLE